MSLFPACDTVPCNQRRGKQCVGIFPRYEGEKALNRRAQYGCTEHGGEWVRIGLEFRLEMSRVVEIGNSTSASLIPLIQSQFYLFSIIFPYNFGSSLQKYACYIYLKTTENKLLFLIIFMWG